MQRTATGFNPLFDTLRGWAAFGVMAFHANLLVPIGWIGLLSFYVLSGYLISRSCLSVERTKGHGIGAYLSFYYRRVVRILPLYWLYVGLLTAMTMVGLLLPTFWVAFPALVGGYYNWFCAFGVGQLSCFYSHLWSLSVEFQFYLVCPFVFFLVPRRMLSKVLWGLVWLSPVVRALTAYFFRGGGEEAKLVAVYFSSFTYMDAFALGALLAIRSVVPSRRGARNRLLGFSLLVALVVGMVSFLPGEKGLAWWGAFGFPHLLASDFSFVWGYSLLHLWFYFLVGYLDTRPVLPWLFDNRMTRYLGEISYGLYIYHLPIFFIAFYLLGLYPDREPKPHVPWLVFLGLYAFTVAVASFSYFVWERRWLLKKSGVLFQ